jgi:hypothetical protein
MSLTVSCDQLKRSQVLLCRLPKLSYFLNRVSRSLRASMQPCPIVRSDCRCSSSKSCSRIVRRMSSMIIRKLDTGLSQLPSYAHATEGNIPSVIMVANSLEELRHLRYTLSASCETVTRSLRPKFTKLMIGSEIRTVLLQMTAMQCTEDGAKAGPQKRG